MRTMECEPRGEKGWLPIREKREEGGKGNKRDERTQAPAVRNKRASGHAHVVRKHRDYGVS